MATDAVILYVSFLIKQSVYLKNNGMAPHFKSILSASIQNSPFCCLPLVESLNAVMQSFQIDLGICCWSKTNNTVEPQYIGSEFLR